MYFNGSFFMYVKLKSIHNGDSYTYSTPEKLSTHLPSSVNTYNTFIHVFVPHHYIHTNIRPIIFIIIVVIIIFTF